MLLLRPYHPSVMIIAVAQACLLGLRPFASRSVAVPAKKQSLSAALPFGMLYSADMSRIRRIEQTDRIFFVTTNLAKGVPNFSPVERNLVLNALGETRAAHKFLLVGYVVMPDHAHALLAVLSSSLPDILRQWKSKTARAIQKARGKPGSLWQARYFDFICRRTRDVANKLDYIHQNPVVARPCEPGRRMAVVKRRVLHKNARAPARS